MKTKLILFLLIGLNFKAYGNNQGLIASLLSQKEESKKELVSLVKRLKDLGSIKYDLTSEQAALYHLHPSLVRSYIFHSEDRYLNYAGQNSCYFLSSFEQGLLKSDLDQAELIPLQDSGGNDTLVRKKDFFALIYKKRCPKQAKLSEDFKVQNLNETLKKLTLNVPDTPKECSEILNKWKKSTLLPFVCAIPSKILNGEKSSKILNQRKGLSLSVTGKLNAKVRESDLYKANLTTFQRQYFASLCQGLINSSNFCLNYTTKDYWALSISGKVPKENMITLCQEYLRKPWGSKLSPGQLQKCAAAFRKDPATCMKLSKPGYPALYPRENCDHISTALTGAILKTNILDCPGKVENAHVTTAYRVARHQIEEISKLPMATDKESCHSQAYSDLYQIYTKAQLADTWPMKACYDDKIEGKKVCKSYIPGSLKDNNLSEESVVTSILYRLGKIDKSVKCKVSNDSDYNPALIQFKTGCHIVNEKFCFHADCEKSIIIDEKKYDILSNIGHMSFDYFPKSWQTQRKSFQSLLEQRYGQQQEPLRNFTQLNQFIKSNPKNLVHGLACLEDLLPQYFTRTAINQCTTHSFVIDGIVDHQGSRKVIVRSSYDSLRSPRLIIWNRVFNAVMNQQSSHPLRQWNLYGLKK